MRESVTATVPGVVFSSSRDLGIVFALKEAQGEHLGDARIEAGERAAQPIADLAGDLGALRDCARRPSASTGSSSSSGMLRMFCRERTRSSAALTAARCRKLGDVADGFGVGVALHHAKEHGLEDVFGIAGIAGDPVGGAEHHGVVFAEDLLPGPVTESSAGSVGAAISAFILSGSSCD